MGTLSVQEFLAGREPCDVCEANGDQHHCITELLSRQDSCLIFNAIENNQNHQTPNDTALLQELRAITSPQKVLDYYFRSQKLTQMINAKSDKLAIWNHVYQYHITTILELVRNRQTDEAYDAIMSMVESLEKEYGVTH
jgi:hypothetical protein